MYCVECGQKNPEGAKFCAFCGARLVDSPLPEQAPVAAPDWDAESIFDRPSRREGSPARPDGAEPAPEPAQRPVDPEPAAAPRPSRGGAAATRRPAETRDPQTAPRPVVTPISPWARPAATDRALRNARNGAPSTIVPRKGSDLPPEEAPKDLFFDGYDDAPPPRPTHAKARPSRERSEMRRLSYLEKNLRGFIGVGLTLVTLLVLAAWLFLFPSGQMMLARFGLTDNATAYARIAENAYASQNYSTAARDYYQALLLDSDNYEYALRTAECYRLAGNDSSASTALTMAIDIDASDVRAYQMLKQLYPDARTRPAAVAELLSQGQTRTGDATLTQ